MEFQVLGPVRVVADGVDVPLPRRRERLVLGVLLLERDHVVESSRLADLVWAGDPPDDAHQQLRVSVSRLRHLLKGFDGVRIASPPRGFAIHVDAGHVDWCAFQAEVEDALSEERADDPAGRVAVLRAALDRWRGPLLADVTDATQRADLGRRLDDYRKQALAARIAAEMSLTAPESLVPELSELVDRHPTDERFAELLMRAHFRSGHPADALRVYHRLADALADEMGVGPGPRAMGLFEEILRADRAPADPPAPRGPNLLPRPATGFTGRRRELTRLDRIADSAGEAGPVAVLSAVTGSAGVGKTALAVHWATAAGERFPDGRLYLDMHGYGPSAPLSPSEALVHLLRELGVPADEMPHDAQAAAGRYRALLAGTATLVVLDNARSADQVRPLLPADPRCMAVVTSRDRLAGLVAMDGARRVEVETLSDDEAVELIVSTVPAARADLDAVRELVARCGRLPLALRIAAAALLEDPHLSVADLVARYSGPDRLSHLVVEGDPDSSVRVALGHSYAQLGPDAQRMLWLAGSAPLVDIAVGPAAALAGCDEATARALLDRLRALHLLADGGPGRYAPHDLVRDYARELAATDGSSDDRAAALDRLLRWYVTHAHHADLTLLRSNEMTLRWVDPELPVPTLGDDQEALAWYRPEIANLVRLVTATETVRPDACWELAWCTTGWNRRERWLGDWIAMFEVALRATRAIGDLTAEQWVRSGLAVAYSLSGRRAEAIAGFERCLEIRRATAAGRRPIALMLTNLGAAHTETEEPGHALPYLLEALGMLDGLDEDRDVLFGVINNLGYTHTRMGDPEEACVWFHRALDLADESGSDVEAAGAAINLTQALTKLDRRDEAVVVAERALRHAIAAGHWLHQARAHSNLSTFQAWAGNLAEARAHLEAAEAAFGDHASPDLDELRELVRSTEQAQGTAR